MVEILPSGPWQRCANGRDHKVCNWVVPAGAPAALCPVCSLNRVVPDLAVPENVNRWARIEGAKRRAFYSLFKMRIPVQSRMDDPQRGLAFDFLSGAGGVPVLTGHDEGVITLNIDEADDAIRERNRQELREHYRTLVGHFRHELAHYYWWLWFDDAKLNAPLLPAFRQVFGDETADYSAAMSHYYAQGVAADWGLSHISAYASMHPWEDWAETWAHYFLIVEALDTTRSFGLDNSETSPMKVTDLKWSPPPFPTNFSTTQYEPFVAIIRSWSRLSPALNEVSQSVGHNPLYPFVLSAKVLEKLYFVHRVCLEWNLVKPAAQ